MRKYLIGFAIIIVVVYLALLILFFLTGWFVMGVDIKETLVVVKHFAWQLFKVVILAVALGSVKFYNIIKEL